jgi:hypothetical protein
MKLLITSIVLFGCLGICNAEETLTEKAQATGNTATRTAKKGVHRTQEALCGKLTGDNKAQCLAKEAKNHVEEGVDATVDKAKEVKNAVDSDKK